MVSSKKMFVLSVCQQKMGERRNVRLESNPEQLDQNPSVQIGRFFSIWRLFAFGNVV
jgi:hypothetical protein